MSSSTSSAGPSATLDIFQSGDDDVVLSGQMAGGGPSATPGSSTPGGATGADFNTLDEPIKETVLRDVRAVGAKFYHVLYPIEKKSLLKVSAGRGKRRRAAVSS